MKNIKNFIALMIIYGTIIQGFEILFNFYGARNWAISILCCATILAISFIKSMARIKPEGLNWNANIEKKKNIVFVQISILVIGGIFSNIIVILMNRLWYLIFAPILQYHRFMELIKPISIANIPFIWLEEIFLSGDTYFYMFYFIVSEGLFKYYRDLRTCKIERRKREKILEQL